MKWLDKFKKKDIEEEHSKFILRGSYSWWKNQLLEMVKKETASVEEYIEDDDTTLFFSVFKEKK